MMWWKYIDGDNSKADAWADDEDASQLWWLPEWPGILIYQEVRLGIDTTNIVYAQRLLGGEDDGWALELAIPLADAGIAAAAGTIFGFEFDVSDDDGEPFSWRPGDLGGRETKLKFIGTEDKTEPSYWGEAELSDEVVTTSAVNNPGPSAVSDFALLQNYPNPFNPQTLIQYSLPAKSFVKLGIYDVNGRQVALPVQAEQAAGFHQVTFDASGLPSGLYFCRLSAGDQLVVRKMTLTR